MGRMKPERAPDADTVDIEVLLRFFDEDPAERVLQVLIALQGAAVSVACVAMFLEQRSAAVVGALEPLRYTVEASDCETKAAVNWTIIVRSDAAALPYELYRHFPSLPYPLVRHFFTWLASEELENSKRSHTGADSPAPSPWMVGAEVLRKAMLNPFTSPDGNWANERAGLLARACLELQNDASKRLVREAVDDLFSNRIDAAAILGRHLPEFATETTPPELTDEVLGGCLDLAILLPKINDGKLSWDSGRHQSFEKLCACVRLLPPLDARLLGHGADAHLVGLASGVGLFDGSAWSDESALSSNLALQPAEIRDFIVRTASLWYDLLQAAAYASSWQARTELSGVQARLVRSIDNATDIWATSAQSVIRSRTQLGVPAIDALTLAAARHPEVRAAITALAAGDAGSDETNFAQGLIARIDGALDSGSAFQHWLADVVARTFDGRPIFPNPLAPLSRIWFGYVDIESALDTAVGSALARFATQLVEQGAADERLLTGYLLAELKNSIDNNALRMKMAGLSQPNRMIRVEHRPTRDREEANWGCDVALLVKADFSPVRMETVELVQVKKSAAMSFDEGSNAGVAHERWRVTIPQLLTLLDMSETSVYWLFCSTGETLCVPAKLLLGLATHAAALEQETFTVGYNDIRHAAVPVSQFLLELFIGLWLGTRKSDVLAFANGDLPNLRPRELFAISLTNE
jgi:hypothetical protein